MDGCRDRPPRRGGRTGSSRTVSILYMSFFPSEKNPCEVARAHLRKQTIAIPPRAYRRPALLFALVLHSPGSWRGRLTCPSRAVLHDARPEAVDA